VKAVADLVPTLEDAFRAGGVRVVAVPIDYSENTRVLIEELKNTAPVLEPA
jgi:acetolactate synthase-1/2/3 large subunit